jgi:hypothetical protein
MRHFNFNRKIIENKEHFLWGKTEIILRFPFPFKVD